MANSWALPQLCVHTWEDPQHLFLLDDEGSSVTDVIKMQQVRAAFLGLCSYISLPPLGPSQAVFPPLQGHLDPGSILQMRGAGGRLRAEVPTSIVMLAVSSMVPAPSG